MKLQTNKKHIGTFLMPVYEKIRKKVAVKLGSLALTVCLSTGLATAMGSNENTQDSDFVLDVGIEELQDLPIQLPTGTMIYDYPNGCWKTLSIIDDLNLIWKISIDLYNDIDYSSINELPALEELVINVNTLNADSCQIDLKSCANLNTIVINLNEPNTVFNAENYGFLRDLPSNCNLKIMNYASGITIDPGFLNDICIRNAVTKLDIDYTNETAIPTNVKELSNLQIEGTTVTSPIIKFPEGVKVFAYGEWIYFPSIPFTTNKITLRIDYKPYVDYNFLKYLNVSYLQLNLYAPDARMSTKTLDLSTFKNLDFFDISIMLDDYDNFDKQHFAFLKDANHINRIYINSWSDNSSTIDINFITFLHQQCGIDDLFIAMSYEKIKNAYELKKLETIGIHKLYIPQVPQNLDIKLYDDSNFGNDISLDNFNGVEKLDLIIEEKNAKIDFDFLEELSKTCKIEIKISPLLHSFPTTVISDYFSHRDKGLLSNVPFNFEMESELFIHLKEGETFDKSTYGFLERYDSITSLKISANEPNTRISADFIKELYSKFGFKTFGLYTSEDTLPRSVVELSRLKDLGIENFECDIPEISITDSIIIIRKDQIFDENHFGYLLEDKYENLEVIFENFSEFSPEFLSKLRARKLTLKFPSGIYQNIVFGTFNNVSFHNVDKLLLIGQADFFACNGLTNAKLTEWRDNGLNFEFFCTTKYSINLPNWNSSLNEINNFIDSVGNEIKQTYGITENSSFEDIKNAIIDWVCKNYSYNEISSKNQRDNEDKDDKINDSRGMLHFASHSKNNDLIVCRHYAVIVQALANWFKIDAEYIRSTVHNDKYGNPSTHAWNILYDENNQSRTVDTTWVDDDGYIEIDVNAEIEDLMDSVVSNLVNYYSKNDLYYQELYGGTHDYYNELDSVYYGDVSHEPESLPYGIKAQELSNSDLKLIMKSVEQRYENQINKRLIAYKTLEMHPDKLQALAQEQALSSKLKTANEMGIPSAVIIGITTSLCLGLAAVYGKKYFRSFIKGIKEEKKASEIEDIPQIGPVTSERIGEKDPFVLLQLVNPDIVTNNLELPKINENVNLTKKKLEQEKLDRLRRQKLDLLRQKRQNLNSMQANSYGRRR